MVLEHMAVIGAALLVASVACADGGEELVRNPGFAPHHETDLPDEWTPWQPADELGQEQKPLTESEQARLEAFRERHQE